MVGGSVLASTGFTHSAFVLFGDADYASTMVMAVLIPLIVASIAYGWIAVLTLRLERSRAELELQAHSDPLTGLANRRAALGLIERWCEAGEAIALGIADIDFFKRINDRLGHEGGDISLVHFAAMLRRFALDDWLVARIGGEEFLIVARGVAPDAFEARIERMRQAVAAAPLITPNGPYHLTASFGMALRLSGESTSALMSRADKALYAAKEAGRNRSARAA